MDPLDDEARQKQEIYRDKGEEARKRRRTTSAQQQTQLQFTIGQGPSNPPVIAQAIARAEQRGKLCVEWNECTDYSDIPILSQAMVSEA
jgi:hypothetical protein